MIDIHSHILPGVDDGARTLSESLEIVRWLANQGFTDVIATPHYVGGSELISSREENIKLLLELKQKITESGINVNIYLGNEIYIDDNIVELLEDGEISALADSKYLLVELPMNDEFPNYEGYLGDLMEHGYKVVLAHPERYVIIQKRYEIAKELFDMGILFQCNYGSVIGKYGEEEKKLLHHLAKNKMIFTFGSDVHHPGRSNYLDLAKKKLAKYYNERELSYLLTINPGKILQVI